jgi:hypothetical protein
MCIIVIFYAPLPHPTILPRKKTTKGRRSPGGNQVTVERVFKNEIKIMRMVGRVVGRKGG